MIQKIITSLNEDRRKYVFDAILANFKKLATDKQGLCVMKKIIEFTKNLESQKQIVAKIAEDCLEYVQNEYGNFVVSEILKHYSFDLFGNVLHEIKGQFVKLSQNKFSSKFIEICIDKAPEDQQKAIIEEFINSNILHKVVESNFGNYVLQHTLGKYCKCQQVKEQLLTAIMQCLSNVTEFKVQEKWGQKILSVQISELQKGDVKDELTDSLQAVMSDIIGKNKEYKQQLSLQINKQKSDPYRPGKGGGFNPRSTGRGGTNSQGMVDSTSDREYFGQQSHSSSYNSKQRGGQYKAKGNEQYRSKKQPYNEVKVIERDNIRFAPSNNEKE